MKRMFVSIVTGMTMLAMGAAVADDNGQGFYVWADVVDVEPLVTTHYEEVPTRYCERKRRNRSIHHRRHRHDDSDAFPVLLGSVIGGAIGRQFGSGDGQRAMTVLGALAGAGIASSSHRDAKKRKRLVCETRYEREAYEVVDGYQVTYSYLGHTFQQTTETHPGDQMRIFVTVDPVLQSTI